MKYLSSIVNCSLGNILEWYDFGLFTIFSPLFSRLFFPTKDPLAALIATFSIFAVGFLCRPFGALIFGYLGDKTGRAKTLRFSVLMISLPTLLIGLIPTYHYIGIGAPLALTFLRIWQGITMGGEYSGNLIYLAETAPKKYRAFFTSFAPMGANLGVLLAALVGIITSDLLTNAQLDLYGWRVPYLLSGLFCLMIYRFRLKIKETEVFQTIQNKFPNSNPIKVVFKYNKRQLLRTIGLACMGSSFYYFCFIYIPIFLKQYYSMSVYHASILMMMLIVLMLFLVPFAGLICDYFGRRKMLLFNSGLIFSIAIPGFYFLQSHYLSLLIITLLIFTIASAFEQSTTSVSVIENFPPPARYTGVSLGYNISNGLLGGTVPIICQWLLTHTTSYLSPAIYITFCAAITGLVALFFVPETKGSNLISIDYLELAPE